MFCFSWKWSRRNKEIPIYPKKFNSQWKYLNWCGNHCHCLFILPPLSVCVRVVCAFAKLLNFDMKWIWWWRKIESPATTTNDEITCILRWIPFKIVEIGIETNTHFSLLRSQMFLHRHSYTAPIVRIANCLLLWRYNTCHLRWFS